MNVYTGIHSYYCGIDLHARTMYVCILDKDGQTVCHKNIHCQPDRFLRTIEPFRNNLVVGVECIFCWYWIADLCEQEGIDFILGHALYMKAIHGVKTKNDRIDSLKIARLMRGGNFPIAYVYPPEMRATRDLMRRRNHFVRKRAELLAHIQNTTLQYNLEPLGTISRPHHRRDKDIVGHFSEAAVLFLRKNPDAERYYNRLINRHGKSKALSIIAKRLGIAVYYMLKRQKPFNINMFLEGSMNKEKA